MALLRTKNAGPIFARWRLMGYIVKLDLESVKELVALLRNATNNLNQIARLVNETLSIYAADMEDMR